MKNTAKSLIEALALGRREHIALVGAGGKTTLMFALAEELTRNGKRVVASTTTKVWHREALQYKTVVLVHGGGEWKNKTRERLGREGGVFVGTRILDSGKVEGISSCLAHDLYQDSDAGYLLVEADGAAGRPVKAPAGHEPVIPGSATMVVALMGLEALDARLEESTVFRVQQVRTVTGLEPGSLLTPSALARIFLDPAGVFKGTPKGARRVVFLNKADLIKDQGSAMDLVDILLTDPMKKIDRVILGSIKERVYKVRTEKEKPWRIFTPKR